MSTAARTTDEQRLLAALEARLARMEPQLRRLWFRALAMVREKADVSGAELALTRGDIDGAVKAIFPEFAMGELQSDLNVAVIQAMLKSAELVMRNDVPSPFRVKLDGPTSAVMESIKRMDLSLIAPIVHDAQAGLRTVLLTGLQRGLNPRVVAREARAFIGLGAYDAKLIASFERQLRDDPATALDRTLRDLRYDGTVRKAERGLVTLSDETIGKMVQAYTQKLHAWRSETLTRTATINALREGQLVAWQEAADAAGIDRAEVTKRWVTTLDGRERPTHHEMHGTVVPIDAPWQVPGAGAQMIPGESEYNCLIGPTRVVAPDLVATTARVFNGEVITLHTAAGHELTATPNHPILTARGWMPARLLREGDQVLRSTRSEWVSARPTDDREHMPPRIDETAEPLLFGLPDAVAREVVIAAKDFHGDAADGDICVIMANRRLLDEFDATLAEHAPEPTLPMRLRETRPIAAQRAAELTIEGIDLATASGMRRSDLLAAPIGIESGPLDALSFGLPAALDVVISENAMNGRATDAADLSEVILALAGEVAMDDIVLVERHAWSGHVYNLETERGWYIANGIITHNCRCTFVVRLRGAVARAAA